MESRVSSPTGSGADDVEAAAALAEIQRWQDRVVEGVLVPFWGWWVFAAAMIAIGVARDSRDSLAKAIVIPLAVLVMAGLIAATIPALRRRVQVYGARPIDWRIGAAIVGLIVLVDGAVIGTAVGLAAAHARYAITIGSVAGAVVIVIAGPLLTRYMRALMLREARRQISDAGPPRASAR